MRAVRIRNVEIAQLLLDKKAKVSANDKKGDTALHIAMRARSKVMLQTLLNMKLMIYNVNILVHNDSSYIITVKP